MFCSAVLSFDTVGEMKDLLYFTLLLGLNETLPSLTHFFLDLDEILSTKICWVIVKSQQIGLQGLSKPSGGENHFLFVQGVEPQFVGCASRSVVAIQGVIAWLTVQLYNPLFQAFPTLEI